MGERLFVGEKKKLAMDGWVAWMEVPLCVLRGENECFVDRSSILFLRQVST